MRRLFVLAALLPFAAVSQLEHARQVTEKLCSPEFHGRGYVNGGDSIAAAFIRNEFTAAGCRFFDEGAFQSFSFPVNTFPGEMQLRVNGKTLVPGADYIVDPSSGGGKAIHQRVYNLTLAAIFDKERLVRELINLRAQKIASSGEERYGAVLLHTSGLKGDSLKMVNELAEMLAAEFAVIKVTASKFTWSVGSEQYRHPLIEVSQSAIDAAAEEIYVDYAIDASLKQHTARNVIAYVPAKKSCKKYIVFSAHYDHLGRMGQATYFPGGNDNASGTAMLVELARHYAAHPTDVNIVFMAFAGEEAGLIGSRYYTGHPLFPLDEIRFLTNVDIMGSGEDGITVVNATLFPKEFELLQEINREKGLLAKVASRGPAANSDHYFFTLVDVPAIFIYTMGPNKHYHDIYDTYEELSFGEFGDLQELLIEFESRIPRKKPKGKKKKS